MFVDCGSYSNDSRGVVVGTGPNGLAAAITLAAAGIPVTAFEADEAVGGGMRSSQLTLPGFVHDECSAVHPLGSASPFFQTLPLAAHGLEWIHPQASLAHPLDDGSAVLLERSIEATAAGLGPDARAYIRLIGPLARRCDRLLPMILRPPLSLPRYPLLLLRFGIPALLPARLLASLVFKGERARALFSGIAAHSHLSLDSLLSASFGLALALLGHAAGWPIARGGSQKIADALAAHLRALGGRIVTKTRVESLDALPPAGRILLDLSPRQVLRICGDRLPASYRKQLRRYHYGPGVFKIDYALEAPVPWTAQECLRAATVHLGGTMAEVAEAESSVTRGDIPPRPFVLVAQPSLFDSSRAPDGKHTLWAYCHVPNGSAFDMTERIEAQIERFAPGFRNRILARRTTSPAGLESRNPNCAGGDIMGGAMDIRQFFARPALRLNPYRTPVRGLYLCSASTPPGGGVHGMCGHHAAVAALRI